jgi:very-short-patch-repair endonuclease
MNLRPLARQLRQRETWAERLVWRWLRDRRFEGYKFRRQIPKGDFIVDFVCEEAALVIELHGSQHGFPEHQARDAAKDAYLTSMGFKTLRFWNGELRRREAEIKETIFRELHARAPHPEPSYWRSGMVGKKFEDSRPHPNPLPRGEGDAR